MINRNHLALFRAVAEAGGFSRAAEVVHVSQPAISMQVGELENALGTPLFDRLPRGVRLTDAGTVLFGYAQRIAALEGEAERAMRELRGLERGRLAVGASKTIGGYLLPAVLGEFRRRHPGVELQLVIDNTDAIKTRLVGGTIDLGLTEGMLPQDDEIRSKVFLRGRTDRHRPTGPSVRGQRSRQAAAARRHWPAALRTAAGFARTGQRHARGALACPGRRGRRAPRSRPDPLEHGSHQARGDRRPRAGGGFAVVRDHGTDRQRAGGSADT